MVKGSIALIVAAIIIVFAGFIYWGSFDFGPGNTPAEVTEEDVEVTEEDVMLEEDDATKTEEDSITEQGEARVFDLTGRNFAFSVTEIKVKKGDKVRINFESADGFHDWVVDEFSANTNRVNTGDKTFVEFIADQAGEFEYYCSVGNHRALGLVGMLVVEE